MNLKEKMAKKLAELEEQKTASFERVIEIRKGQHAAFLQRLRQASNFIEGTEALNGYLSPEMTDKAVLEKAESLAVEAWEIPPHWRYLLDCKQCGPMPSAINDESLRVIHCPWCMAHPIEEAE